MIGFGISRAMDAAPWPPPGCETARCRLADAEAAAGSPDAGGEAVACALALLQDYTGDPSAQITAGLQPAWLTSQQHGRLLAAR